MCKAITLQLRRCRRGANQGDYCGTHSMEIDAEATETNVANLSEVCRRIQQAYFDAYGIKLNFSTNLNSEAVRAHIYGDILPFLRDCWKMGIPNADLPVEHLRTHYEVIGNRSEIVLPQRTCTPDERRQEVRRIRHARQEEYRQRLQRLMALNQGRQNDAINAAAFAVVRAPVPAAVAPAAPGLPPIANDTQSVHRTSVNESVKESIKIINNIPWNRSVWPVLHEDGVKFPGGRKLFEYIFLWSDIYTKEESKKLFPKLLPLLGKNAISDIVNIDETVFGVKPWVVLYKTIQWAFERPHEEQKEIFKRVLEESSEGMGMCIQGKMARFANILCGFHPDIRVGLSGKELLQDRMSRLAQRNDIDAETKMEEGRGILRDAEVREEEWDTWLEPLLLF